MPLIPVNEGGYQIDQLGLDLVDVADMLAEAYDCAEERRKRGIFELCVRRGGVEIKFVGRRVDYHPDAEGPAMLIWHAKPTGG